MRKAYKQIYTNSKKHLRPRGRLKGISKPLFAASGDETMI